ncbi:MAG: Ig-like domain-containing protein [candidate division KSB1 bacterium]|nr:Ig-like domain-containing protein [candidate division KSB1 bacterium]
MMHKPHVVRWGMVGILLGLMASWGHAQTIVDNFNRATLGSNWTADAAYQIVNNELANTSTNYTWAGFLAVFNAMTGPTSVSFKWGTAADANGIREGALAVLLDANSVNANGYMIWHHGTNNRIYLYTIANGVPGVKVAEVVPNLPAPVAGQVMKVVITSDATGYRFDLYINDVLDGTLTDPLKRTGNLDGYAGVILKGNLNNNVDDFTVSKTGGGAETRDDFNRADGDPGPNWTADPVYQIVSQELANTNTNYVWGDLAIFNAHPGPNMVQYTWGATADAAGIHEGAFAVMLDANDVNTANGYMVWHATTRLYLWTIEAGIPKTPITNIPAALPPPTAGQTVKVLISENANGYHFDYYINDQFDGRVSDPLKRVGSINGYAGVMLRGGLNNNIDDFVAATIVDNTPPAAVTNLAVSGTTANSVTLTWTAPGDDGTVGTAASYDLRYSTSPITATNFDAATQATGLGTPKAAGSTETFTVTGLNSATTYYFALKATDDSGNKSAISNVVTATTQSPVQYATYWDTFERAQLGDDWAAHSAYVIENGELKNNITSGTAAWGYAAVFKKFPKPRAAMVVWSETATTTGIGQGAVCAFMDQPSPNANGYMIFHIDTRLFLYTINAGNPGVQVQLLLNVTNQPAAGDTFKVVISSDATGHHFDVYKNRTFVGRLNDASRLINPATWYVGAYLKGGTNYGGKNNIEAFGVELTATDPAKVEYWSGDAQTGRIGDALPQPLKVLVTDNNNVPVPGVYVDFAVTSGAAGLSTDIASFDGNIWLEAESGTVETPMVRIADADASDGMCVGVPTVNTTNDTGKVEIHFFVPQSGTYYLWVRYKAPDNLSNSFYVKKDKGAYALVNLTVSAPWAWSKYATAFSFTKGGHSLTLKNAEDGTLLDKILLTTSATYTPTGLGSAATTYADKRTDGDGLASAICTLGMQVGTVTIEARAYYRGDQLSGSPVTFTETAVGGEASRLIYVSGDSVFGQAGQRLAQPFVVKVTDAFGNGVPNVAVTFTVLEGGGTLSNTQPVMTDNNGFASTYLTLGFGSYVQRVQASAPGLQGSPIVFRAYAAGLNLAMSKISGDGQSGTVGTVLAQPLVVKVAHVTSGDPVAGFPVTFVITGGGGKLDGAATTKVANTDASGQASVTWTLGDQAGTNTCEARATGVSGSPLVFTAIAQPGTPTTFSKISPLETVTGPVGMPLEQPFKVRVTDAKGNGISGHPVRFVRTMGSGTMDGMTERDVVTDANGYAQVIYVMGSVVGETNRVEASAQYQGAHLTGSPVVFTAISTEGVAHQLAKVSGDGQSGTVGTALPAPFVVRVTDILGNPISNHPVRFAVIAGGGTIDGQSAVEVNTNAEGLASATLTLGQVAGREVHVVEVTSHRNQVPLSGSPKYFKASATPGTPSRLIYVSGNYQSAAVGTTLNEPLKVKVADAFGNGIKQHLVTFKVIAGGGNFAGIPEQNVYTDTFGVAMAFLTLGTQPGQNNNVVEASAKQSGVHLDGSPFTFYATASPGIASALQYVSGRNQAAEVGTALPQPLVVRVVDSFGNAVVGHNVTFSVMEGGGTLAGQTQRNVLTLSDGTARVVYTLGTVAGTLNNMVRASVPGLSGSPVDFYATALPGPPAALVEVSGNGQTGAVGTPLPQPFKTKVVDNYQNPISGHIVTFRVVSGGGNLAGATRRDVFTDTQGIGQVTLTLGSTPGVNNNVVEATSVGADSVPLPGSGMRFIASATVGAPNKLVIVSGNNQEGIVGNPLPQMLTVKVTDSQNNPIIGHPVTFRVMAGGGTLDGMTDTVRVVPTDVEGKAAVFLILGPVAGQNNNIVHATATYGGNPLNGSPAIFTASARSSNAASIEKVSGDGQSGAVGRVLPQPLRVRARDRNQNPVAGHPITFKVVAGGGRLNGIGSQVVVNTGSDGIAEATWELGTTAGTNNNTVEVTATDGVMPLTGSPLYFTASAYAGSPDPSASTLSATSPIPADGVTKSPITIRLRDQYNNPVPGAAVVISATGSNNIITQPMSLTDAKGETQGYLASTKAEIKVVSARVVTHGVDLLATVQVRFTPLAAAHIVEYGGNGQIGNIGTALAHPLQVRVTDANQNGIAGYAVQFVVTAGGGRIVEPQPVYTDSSGVAKAQWILGGAVGYNRAEARASGLTGSPVVFTAFGMEPTPTAMVIYSGNNQTGIAGRTLPQPLVVRVTDALGVAVYGRAVRFEVILGDGAIVTPAVDTTDAYGLAETYLTLSRTAGLNLVRATCQGLSTTVTFTAQARSDVATKLEAFSGDKQSYVVGHTLPLPLVARALDKNNNPVAGVPVTFTVVQGNGSLPIDNTRITDNEGKASIPFTLGTAAGTYLVRAASAGLTPVVFTAVGVPDAPAALIYVSGDDQTGSVGRETVFPLQVRVTDQYGNPVPNASVTFVVIQGGGSIVEQQPVFTNANGIASVRWILGPTVGENKCLAYKPGCAGSPIEFTAVAVENAFPQLVLPKSISVQETQRVRFTVVASDADGDPLTYHARKLPAGATFDSLATRVFDWTPNYAQAGVYYPVFIVRDNKGGIGIDSVRIEVLNFNRPPHITGYWPVFDEVHIVQPDSMTFMVDASDLDGDSLRYEWTVAGIITSTTNSYTLRSAQFSVGNYDVKVKVSDGYDTIQRAWHVRITTTAVELESFAARAVPYEGVVIEWKTGYEMNNLGFQIMRSCAPQSGYVVVSDQLIPSRADRTYSFIDKTATESGAYYYKLVDIDRNGARTEHGPIAAVAPVPANYSLAQNYPNPFNPVTTIRYELPTAGRVSVKIYNIYGQLVRTLVEEQVHAGYHTLQWDGRDEFGQAVSSGVYYYRMVAGTFVETKKMALLR